MNLRHMASGKRGHIESMGGDIDRLWEMGVRPGVTIEVVKGGDPCVIKLKGSVLAIAFRGLDIDVRLES